jgi:hypothetical protein
MKNCQVERGEAVLKRSLQAVLFLLLTTGSGFAAEEKMAPLSMFFELLGNGGAYSINADYRIQENCSVRLGIVTWKASGLFGANDHLTAFPLLVNYLYGSGNHWLELGGGVLYGRYKVTSGFGDVLEDYNFTTLTGTLSYRYQRPHGGLFFKAGLTPLYPLGSEAKKYPAEATEDFLPWAGIAWGYTF